MRSSPPRPVEKEYTCEDCGQIIATCRYGYRASVDRWWTPEEIAEDWDALVRHRITAHACPVMLDKLFALS